jgi:hypothetical protein
VDGTHHTHPLDRQWHQRHHLAAVAWLGRRELARFELGFCAVWHAGVAFVIGTFPRDRIVTPTTEAIFGTVPLAVWVVWFGAVAVAAGLATAKVTPLRVWLAWCGVFPLGLAWIYGSAVSTVNGSGNAIFALLWPALLVWWAITALRLYLSGQGTRWDG